MFSRYWTEPIHILDYSSIKIRAGIGLFILVLIAVLTMLYIFLFMHQNLYSREMINSPEMKKDNMIFSSAFSTMNISVI